MYDKEVIRRNLTIIALNILIESYSIALEEKELTEDETNFLITCINESKSYLEELLKDFDKSQLIKRPVWKT